MEKQVIKSKCDNCGSELVYNPKQGCLTCKYCEANFILPTQNRSAKLVRQYNGEFHPNQLNQNLIAYRCDSCRHIYYISSEGMSKKCPNCGNPSSIVVQDDGICADGIIPFSITKKQASEFLLKHLKKKSGVPRKLKEAIKNQKLMGVFVPVWNFSFNISATYSATISSLAKYSDGTYYSVKKPLFGEKHKLVKSWDVSSTLSEEDCFLDLFDENDYAKIIPYTPEYTYGFRVDKIDKSIHEYYYSITNKAEQSYVDEVKKEIYSKYKSATEVEVSSKISDVFFNFTYVPVYVNTYTHKGKVYKYYVSGTTGKASGKHPTSFLSLLKSFFKFVGVVGIIALLILFFANLN